GKVRHCLISYVGSGASQDVKRTKEQAKKFADSLVTILKKDNKKFAEFVKNYSDDGGKKMPPNKKESDEWMGKDGNYGWVNDNSGFVESFKRFALDGKKGDLAVVESNFGYHIMEVLDVSKGHLTKYKLAMITRKIEPSDATRSKYFAQAAEFGAKNTSKELFDKAVESQKLNKRLADNIKENDKSIPGIENPKELVRWVYSAKKGEVSKEPFTFGNRYVVAIVSEIKEKGTAPFEQVKDDLTMKAKKEKKAEMYIQEFNEKLAGVKSATDLASKMKLNADRTENLLFNSFSINGVGRDDAFCGAASVLKANTLSKPIKGEVGVYVIEIESVKEVPAKDFKTTQKNSMMAMGSRVDYEVFEALRTLASIEDHKAKFDY
ncbi:MAG TPA: peptidyl-prolyl cis-trans isomerase, partial [Nitrosopumilaceae archaeon]|nr:peptidyl-prolyl cis-trans isomerase [Nitrosopumilaceae archaeon]